MGLKCDRISIVVGVRMYYFTQIELLCTAYILNDDENEQEDDGG